MQNDMQDILRKIPQIEKILTNPIFKHANKKILKNIATKEVGKLKNTILNGDLASNDCLNPFDALINIIDKEYKKQTSASLQCVINATGVVLQTNLGRSIFHKNVLDEVFAPLSHYNNLEYDLENGTRGERYEHVANMLCAMFGVESALVVNNNAASIFLILNTFAKDREAIVSRGELVEIGGSFRIHEIMKNAGVNLVEVGATNKTKLNDYQSAISDNTTMIIKVHKSNFDMVGFTQEVEIEEISALCKSHNKENPSKKIIDFYDFGSGNFRGNNEPNLESICKNPPSLLSFSGDKLFGSIQSGIILGKKDLIDRLKQNHLLRALRVDKVTILLLQATLKRYIENRLDEIPTIQMLSKDIKELAKNAHHLIDNIDNFFNPNIIELQSVAGGGSLPNKTFQSIGISLFVKHISAKKLEQLLRASNIIARILNNQVVLDMRTIQDDEFEAIINILHSIKKDLISTIS